MFDSIKSLGRLGLGVVTAVLLLVALVAISLTRAFRSEMIIIRPEFLLHMAATGIAIVAIWNLLAGEVKLAGRLGTMALIAFVLANVPIKLPGTWKLGTVAINESDKANARQADALEVPRVVPGVSPRFTKDGSPRYYWSPSDEPPVFYDRDGIHPDKGTPLRAVDSDQIYDMILRRQAEVKKVPEAPQKVVEVFPSPAPTPSPEPVEVPVAQVSPQVTWDTPPQPIRIRAKPMRPKVNHER